MLARQMDVKEVEAALRSHPTVEDCVVLAREVDPGSEELVAYVVQSGPFVPDHLRAHLKAVLPAGAVPGAFVPLANLPLGPDGKLDEGALTHLEVIDADLVQRWENSLQTIPEIGQAAVVAQERDEGLPMLHLSDLLLDWKTGRRNGVVEALEAAPGTGSTCEGLAEPRLAVSVGNALSFAPDDPTTLPEALRRAATRKKDKGIYYLQGDGSELFQPYEALLDEAERVLGGLRALGLKAGDKVLFQLELNRDFLAAFWGCILGGIIPVPVSIPPTYEQVNSTVSKLHNAWEMLDRPIVLSSTQMASAVGSLSGLLHLEGFRVETIEHLRASARDSDWHDCQAEDVVLMLLTSGSTGKPKAVMQSHRALLSRSAGTAQRNHFSFGEVSLNWFPLDHVGGIVMFHVRDIYLGCTQVQVPTQFILQQPLRWLDLIERFRVTVTWAPNFAFGLVNAQADEFARRHWDLSSLRFILNGGEAIVAKTARRFLELLAPHRLPATAMHPAWGMSETSSGVTYSDDFSLATTSERDSLVEVGGPIPGVSLRIVDGQNHLLEEGRIGALQVKGATVTSGYYRNPELNQEVFTPDGWFNTGDLGFLRQGRLTITGRQKDVIIVNGVNFYCHEIEAVVEEVAGVEVSYTAACAVREPGRNTDSLAIFFHPLESTGGKAATILKDIRGKVVRSLGVNPAYLIPVGREMIPKTEIGKIQRAQLRERFEAGEFDSILRQVDLETRNANTLPDWFYRKVWRPKELVTRHPSTGPLLVFIDRLGLGKFICEGLDRLCVTVEPGPDFARLRRHHYCITPGCAEHYHRLLQSLAEDEVTVDQVLHLWTYDALTDEPISKEALAQAHELGIYSILFMAQALARVQAPEHSVGLLVVSSHTQATVPEDTVAYERTPLLGLIKTIPQEMPQIDCRHLDLSVDRLTVNAAHVLSELRSGGDREVAYRSKQRLVPRLEKISWASLDSGPLPFKQSGMYLITGGLGGIGVEVARYLLDRYQARLLLVGRTSLPERSTWGTMAVGGEVSERIKAYESLERLGGRLTYEAVDVGDAQKLRQVVGRTEIQWDCVLDGVIHLAGVHHERLLVEETRESLGALLHPKVQGTWALHQLIKDQPDSLFIAFSSVASFFAPALYGAYASANCFLEGLTHHQRHQMSLRSYCFAWSAWTEVGMNRSRDGKKPLRAQGRGIESLSAEQGLHSLLAGLHQDQAQMLIGLDGTKPYVRRHLEYGTHPLWHLCAYFTARSDLPLERLKTLEVRDRFQTPSTCLFRQVKELPRTTTGQVDREQLARAGTHAGRQTAERVAPGTKMEVRTAAIWQEVIGVPEVGLHDNFFELGGHSLLATQVLTRLAEAFGIELTLSNLFEAPTVAQLCQRMVAFGKALAEPGQSPLVPVARQGELPLSFAQQRLWFFDQLVPGTPSYNLPSVYRLTGKLDVEALEESLSEIQRRHEALRTTFPATAGRPHQVIASARPVPLEVHEMKHLPGPEREAEAIRLATQMGYRPFDLAGGPLFRTGLFRLGLEDHVLLVATHHIVSDGWSLGVFTDELTALYRAFATGKPSPLPDLPVQYADYAIWQRGWLQGKALERAMAYWLRRLAGAASLDLPTDRPRPAAPGYQGATRRLALPAGLCHQLRALGQAERTTLFMTLLAAFQVLLARSSGQEDVVVGVPVANRNRREVESLIGFFVNNLPIRLDLSGDPPFRKLLGRLRESVLSDFAHQDLPFEKLVEELRLPRETGRIPLCAALFVFQNGPLPTPNLEGLKVSALQWDDSPRSDLDCYLWEDGEAVQGYLVFDRDLFEIPTIDRLARQFRVLVESIAKNPDTSVSELALHEAGSLPGILPARLSAQRCPLSYHQERMWFIDNFETGTVYPSHPVYHNLPLLIHLRGRVHHADLEAGLRGVVARHGALRTRIANAGGELFQVVDQGSNLQLRVVNHTDSTFEQAVEEALSDACRPFALDQDLPMRAALFLVAEDECLLAVTVHHMAADRRSLEILAGELAEFCKARAEGRQPLGLEMPLQYTDYTLWQRQLPGETFEQMLGYWKWRLRGRLPPLELPEDRARPAIHTFTGARLPVTVGERLTRRLAALGQAEGYALDAVLLSAWKVLLHRYARQDEIVVGVSAAARNQPGSEKLIGPLANLLVLRMDLGGNPPFCKLLAEVARELHQARAHQEMPFDRLVLELKPEPDMSRTALFDVLFHYDEAPPDLEFGTARGRVIDTNLGHGKYDLHLSLRGGEGGLTGSLVYNTDIYDRFKVEQMLRHFEAVLEAVARDPDQPVEDVRLLSEAEERQQLVEWNASRASYPEDRTVHQLFEDQAMRTPDRTAVVCGGESLTYRELDERANRLAHHLREQGVKPDDLVAVCLERSVDLVVTLLAVMKAGGAYLPLDPDYPQERLRFQVADARARYLVTTERLAGRVPAEDAAVTRLDADAGAIGAWPATAPAAAATPDNLIYCLYTSGSTGTPKGVLLEHRNVVRLMVNSRLQFSFTADDVWTMFHSYNFDFSVWEMYGALLYGGKLVVVPRAVATDTSGFLDLVERERVTVLNQTPSAFGSFMREAQARSHPPLPLRYVVFGGEACHPGQLRRWREAYPAVKMINMYGITETTVHVTFKEITDREVEQDVSNIGLPIPTTTTYIMDARLQLLPVGVAGEMCVGGLGVCRGYLGRPELTRERFVPNPYRPSERLYRSGDLVKYLPGGEMVYLGRIDDQVQVRGFRVELGEVRSQLLTHRAVAAAEVAAWQPPGETAELAAYVVAKGEVSVAGLRAHLAESLPHYMVPSAFVFLPAMPLTPSGKVDRKALPPPQTVQSDETRGFVAPRDPVEERVAGIWAQVLGLDRIGVHDNFFELGGHSLRATQVLAQIREVLHVKLPLCNIFEAPTVAGLAQRVHAARLTGPTREATPLRPTSRPGPLPLSASQQGLWFIDQLLPGTASYNIPFGFWLTGPLNDSALEKSLEEIYRRHEVLRTTFPLVNGEPAQVVGQSAFRLTRVDLRPFPAAGRQAEARRLAREEAQRPFDLTQGPLLRSTLVKVEEEIHFLLLTLHHIAVDGWSLDILLRELGELYEQFAMNKPSPLPELQLQYADYANWQRQWLEGEACIEQVAYWKAQLDGANMRLELLTDRPRPPVQTLRGARQFFVLRGSLVDATRALSQDEGTTLFMTLLAVFKTFLFACTDQEDLLVGSPFANRTRAELDGVVGPFVNTVVLRTRLCGNQTFRDLLRRVREVVLGASSHQELPFEKVVEALRPPRDPSRNPLFQVNFRVQTAPLLLLRLKGVNSSAPEIIDSLNSKFDLALELWADAENPGGFFEYSTDLFEMETIIRMVGELERLLGEVLTRPEVRLNELDAVKEIRARRAPRARATSLRAARRKVVDL
jgi:amino acid adenylation domain-containing protein